MSNAHVDTEFTLKTYNTSCVMLRSRCGYSGLRADLGFTP